MVPEPQPMLSGYPLAAPLLAPKKGRSNPPGQLVQCHEPTITGPLFELIPPFLGKMTVVQGPLFDVRQLRSHLTSNLGTSLCFSSLCGCVMSVRGFRGCKPLKASLSLRSAATAAMEPTPTIALGPRTLAQGPATGLSLAPLTLPVWAVKPWFGIVFHCAQLSSVYGVLLYPILDGFARHA